MQYITKTKEKDTRSYVTIFNTLHFTDSVTNALKMTLALLESTANQFCLPSAEEMENLLL